MSTTTRTKTEQEGGAMPDLLNDLRNILAKLNELQKPVITGLAVNNRDDVMDRLVEDASLDYKAPIPKVTKLFGIEIVENDIVPPGFMVLLDGNRNVVGVIKNFKDTTD